MSDLCELDSISLPFDWAFVLAASQELPEEEEKADQAGLVRGWSSLQAGQWPT